MGSRFSRRWAPQDCLDTAASPNSRVKTRHTTNNGRCRELHGATPRSQGDHWGPPESVPHLHSFQDEAVGARAGAWTTGSGRPQQRGLGSWCVGCCGPRGVGTCLSGDLCRWSIWCGRCPWPYLASRISTKGGHGTHTGDTDGYTLSELRLDAALPRRLEAAVLGFLRTPRSVDLDKIVELW